MTVIPRRDLSDRPAPDMIDRVDAKTHLLVSVMVLIAVFGWFAFSAQRLAERMDELVDGHTFISGDAGALLSGQRALAADIEEIKAIVSAQRSGGRSNLRSAAIGRVFRPNSAPRPGFAPPAPATLFRVRQPLRH